MQPTGVGGTRALAQVRGEDLFDVAADVAGVDPQRMDGSMRGGDADVAAVAAAVAEAGYARVLPEHARVLGVCRGADGLGPAPAVLRRRAHEPRVLALGVAGRVVVTGPELAGGDVDRRRRPE